MAGRGDYLTILVDQHSSAVSPAIVAETTSVSVDFSAEALETTSQDSGLNASFIPGKVSCTVSGDFLLASDAANFSLLFAKLNAGTLVEVEVEINGTALLAGHGVITSLTAGGANSDALATGAFTIQCSGDMAL